MFGCLSTRCHDLPPQKRNISTYKRARGLGRFGRPPPPEFGCAPTGVPGALGAPRWRSWGAFWLFFGAVCSSLVLLGAQRPAEAKKSPPGVSFGVLLVPKMMNFDNFPSPSFFILFDALFRLMYVTLWVLFCFFRVVREKRAEADRTVKNGCS